MNETPSNPASPPTQQRIAGRIAQTFVRSKLTPLVIIGALFFGFFSTLQTPREEEPQIVVPMLDVFVQLPGASADEVSERITAPMEKLVSELPGVEYVYSISHPGLSMLIVRFYVGTKQEDALVRAYNKLYGNLDLMPPGASQPSKSGQSTTCHPGAYLVGIALRCVSIAPNCRRARTAAEASKRDLGNHVDRRPAEETARPS